MVRRLRRLVRRLLVLALGIFAVWLIVFVVFRIADNRLPWILSVAVTYGIAAYIILPRAVRLGLKILQRKHVPRYTITGDGQPGDPVNLVLTGTRAQLDAAFARAGWSEADRLSLKSSWRMVRAFLLNSPYPTAPFSTLYLYGRGQDVGFQKAIDDSPRKRHHICFWGLEPAARASGILGTAELLAEHRPAAGSYRFLDRRRHQRYRLLVHATDVSGSPTPPIPTPMRNATTSLPSCAKPASSARSLHISRAKSSPPSGSTTMSPTDKLRWQASTIDAVTGPAVLAQANREAAASKT